MGSARQMPTTKLLLYIFILIIKSSYDLNIHSKSRREMVQFGKQLMFHNSTTLTLLLYIILIIFYTCDQCPYSFLIPFFKSLYSSPPSYELSSLSHMLPSNADSH